MSFQFSLGFAARGKTSLMAEDHIRYDILAQEALRGVVKKVLSEVIKTGLPGEHHFFISFATRAPGVRISQRLLEKYDSEMTIVLQNQFWDLKVADSHFEVGLSFDDHGELLIVPFAAIKGFFDPSVQFALQFDVAGTEDDDKKSVDETEKPDSTAKEKLVSEKSDDKKESGDKVVSLDSFRKKP